MNYASSSCDRPLFIVGCVRSGTTLVRDLLRRQSNVICPEETHYFRYGEPFRTVGHANPVSNSQILRKHREMDGVSEEAFAGMLEKSHTRGELMRRHVHHMAHERGLQDFRWFDKTPQNIYGIALIRSEFPNARFLHLVRNPLNVVASLKLGKVIKVPDIHGACNYWIEAVEIIRQMAPQLNECLMEIRYEDLTQNPLSVMRKLLEFSGLGDEFHLYSKDDVHAERNQYLEVLTKEEIDVVQSRCSQLASRYGYHLKS